MKKLFIILILIFYSVLNLYADTDKDVSSILISSFNIQFYGINKSKEPITINTIKNIISIFDIVAIQETQDRTGIALKRLYRKLGGKYNYIVGPRLGYSKVWKEQYVFFYKNSTVTYISSYTYDDRLDEFSREPLIAHFKLKNIKNKDLVLINIHTPPKFATREIHKLPDVIINAQKKYPNMDVILLGDFNADCNYFEEDTYKEIFSPDKYVWAIDNNLDTTVSRTICTYDRMVLSISMLANYDFQSGVLKFDEIYKLSYVQAKKVSDHYPIWIKLIHYNKLPSLP